MLPCGKSQPYHMYERFSLLQDLSFEKTHTSGNIDNGDIFIISSIRLVDYDEW
jgi:hypothetical protein